MRAKQGPSCSHEPEIESSSVKSHTIITVPYMIIDTNIHANHDGVSIKNVFFPMIQCRALKNMPMPMVV